MPKIKEMYDKSPMVKKASSVGGSKKPNIVKMVQHPKSDKKGK